MKKAKEGKLNRKLNLELKFNKNRYLVFQNRIIKSAILSYSISTTFHEDKATIILEKINQKVGDIFG